MQSNEGSEEKLLARSGAPCCASHSPSHAARRPAALEGRSAACAHGSAFSQPHMMLLHAVKPNLKHASKLQAWRAELMLELLQGFGQPAGADRGPSRGLCQRSGPDSRSRWPGFAAHLDKCLHLPSAFSQLLVVVLLSEMLQISALRAIACSLFIYLGVKACTSKCCP